MDARGPDEVPDANRVCGAPVRRLLRRAWRASQRSSSCSAKASATSPARGSLIGRFRLAQKGKPPLPTIDGFTPDQQFFIAWGQFRGDALRPEFARTMVQGDPHPIGKFRVIGPLSNLPEFAAAFSCKPDAAMVRPAADRCEVW